MKKFIKPPGAKGGQEQEKDKKHRTVPKDGRNEINPDEKVVVKDWELDFTQKENVDRVIQDYTI